MDNAFTPIPTKTAPPISSEISNSGPVWNRYMRPRIVPISRNTIQMYGTSNKSFLALCRHTQSALNTVPNIVSMLVTTRIPTTADNACAPSRILIQPVTTPIPIVRFPSQRIGVRNIRMPSSDGNMNRSLLLVINSHIATFIKRGEALRSSDICPYPFIKRSLQATGICCSSHHWYD